jgi:hypothetical protein
MSYNHESSILDLQISQNDNERGKTIRSNGRGIPAPLSANHEQSAQRFRRFVDCSKERERVAVIALEAVATKDTKLAK